MKALQFCKVDMIRSRSQLRILLVFAVFAFFISRGTSMGSLFGVVYMVFGAIIFSAQPFNIEQVEESGFINMLPGTKRDRVAGRFLFSLALLTFAILVGAIIAVVMRHQAGVFGENYINLFAGIAAIGLTVSSLQNILFYAIGKGKSQQMMSIIRMVPGFAVFFIGMTIIEKVQGNSGVFYAKWIMAHANVFFTSILGIAVILFAAGIFISTSLIQNRDFN